MSQAKVRASGWQGICLVAATYVYFLIFAQFAFLHRLADLGIAGSDLKVVMATMALGGIVLSLLAPRTSWMDTPATRLRAAFAACAAAAGATFLPLGLTAAIAVAGLVGAALGLLTVTLVTHLCALCGPRNPLLQVGIGTGAGYFLCNVPAVFNATPQAQSIGAAALCILAASVVPHEVSVERAEAPSTTISPQVLFVLVVASFAALVWLDSAAFFIIQNTPVLKAGTWQGTAHLWANAALHGVSALAAAWLLSRRGLALVLALAFGFLGCACLLLLDPARALPASIFYPIGVSLYSVALVAYPSILAGAPSLATRGRQAGWIYAIAGWMGSALGIGMALNLGHVPMLFVGVAGVVVLFPTFLHILRTRRRELLVTAILCFAALAVYRVQRVTPSTAQTAIQRGRRVYISEGCINCHSQYVRPNSPDVLMWGPVSHPNLIHAERPPLIGNRRQGPDLAQVGGRRSPLWLKMHFYNPAQVSGASIMPSYAFLFRDQRGNDLVAYLASLRGPGLGQHIADEQQWHLSSASISTASVIRGHQLYAKFCATCHTTVGATHEQWLSSFSHPPADLTDAPLTRVPSDAPISSRLDALARIAKFGIPGTDMPGHEYLSDNDIASISLWLAQNTSRPTASTYNPMPFGDK